MELLNLTTHEEYFGIIVKDFQESNSPKIELSERHFTAFGEHQMRYCYCFQKMLHLMTMFKEKTLSV